MLFILCQGTCFTSWWEIVLWTLKVSSFSLFSYVTYHSVSFCSLCADHLPYHHHIHHSLPICYVCLLNTTVPLPNLYFLVIKVCYILNSCLSRRDLSYLHGTVQWFQHNFIVVWSMADYKLKVSVGLLVALDASLRCIAQITQIKPHSALFVAQRTQEMF